MLPRFSFMDWGTLWMKTSICRLQITWWFTLTHHNGLDKMVMNRWMLPVWSKSTRRPSRFRDNQRTPRHRAYLRDFGVNNLKWFGSFPRMDPSPEAVLWSVCLSPGVRAGQYSATTSTQMAVLEKVDSRPHGLSQWSLRALTPTGKLTTHTVEAQEANTWFQSRITSLEGHHTTQLRPTQVHSTGLVFGSFTIRLTSQWHFTQMHWLRCMEWSANGGPLPWRVELTAFSRLQDIFSSLSSRKSTWRRVNTSSLMLDFQGTNQQTRLPMQSARDGCTRLIYHRLAKHLRLRRSLDSFGCRARSPWNTQWSRLTT